MIYLIDRGHTRFFIVKNIVSCSVSPRYLLFYHSRTGQRRHCFLSRELRWQSREFRLARVVKHMRKIEMRIKWMNVRIIMIFVIFFSFYFGAVIIVSFKLCDDSLCVFTLPFTFHFFLIGYWKEVTTLVKIYVLFIKKIFSF